MNIPGRYPVKFFKYTFLVILADADPVIPDGDHEDNPSLLDVSTIDFRVPVTVLDGIIQQV